MMDQIPEVGFWKYKLMGVKLLREDLERSRRLPTWLPFSARTMQGDLTVSTEPDLCISAAGSMRRR